MMRREDWPLQLNACIEAGRARRFERGVWDCVLFAADCVRAMTGEDPAAWARDLYTTKLQALRILHERGGMAGVVTGALGAPLMKPSMAQRGDVVLFDWNDGEGLGVVVGGTAAVPAAEGGLHFAPMKFWKRAWRV